MRLSIQRSVLSIILFLTAFPAQAAVVYLKDGSQLHGTVVGATARDVELYTPNGTLRIGADKITHIDYSSEEKSVYNEEMPVEESERPRPRRQRWRAREEESLHQMFSFDLGFASPLSRISASDTGGNSGRNGETGVHLGTQYLYQNTPRLGTGVNLEYFNRSATSDFGLIPSAETNVYGGTFQILGVMKYSFTSYGSARPYFLGGVGMDHTSTVIDATPLPGFSWSDTGTWETRRLADDDHWGLATTARLGIDFSLIESMIATFEVGWMGIHNRAYQTTSAGKDLGLNDVTGNLRSLIVAMRWGWKF